VPVPLVIVETNRIMDLPSASGMCRVCRTIVPARYVLSGDVVFLERDCPAHGASRARVAGSARWFRDAMAAPRAGRPPRHTTPRDGDCPTSCGPCTEHLQRCHLPVFSITNACDLRCPICFTFNREDRTYFMSAEEFDARLDRLVESTGGVDLVNITGGEPTLHPDLLDLLGRARRPGIGRVTVNTNGLTIARDADLAERLADAGVYVVLSLDTLDRRTSERIHGRDIVDEKRAALEALEKAGVPTTLLMVLISDVNETELPTVLDLTLERDFVRSLTIQTMTYTGQGGGTFEPRRHLPVDEVERSIEGASGGRIREADFQPLPTAHPLCYGVTYLLTSGGGPPAPLSRILGRDALAKHLADGYLLRPSEAFEDEMRLAIDRLWSEGAEPDLLRTLREMLIRLYPPGEALTVHERQRRAERMVKTIYVHAHMDEDTYDVARARRCPDQVPVDDGGLISACNYNLFYRMKDERFWKTDGTQSSSSS
jgi:tetraether lipid synthase